LKIRFIENMIIDGIRYEKGEVEKVDDWLAEAFIGTGKAEAARFLPRLPEKPAGKKPQQKKEAKK
jgi:hypothetical protein